MRLIYKHLLDEISEEKRKDNLAVFEKKHVYDKSFIDMAAVLGSKLYETKKTDRRKLYRYAVGFDMQSGKGVDCVADLTEGIPSDFTRGSFDHVDCISVLEHVQKPWLFAETVQNMLSPRGSFLVSVPCVWRVHGYPSDYWRYTLEGVKSLFPFIEWEHICYMAGGVEIGEKVPSVQTDKGTFFINTDILGYGFKK